MKIKLIISILIFVCFSVAYAQKTSKYFGTWINCELYNELKLNKPFDSIAKITPRFFYFNNSKKIQIEIRFEQKSQYKIIRVTKDTIFTTRSEVFLKNDTLIVNDKYWGRIKFLKYNQFPSKKKL